MKALIVEDEGLARKYLSSVLDREFQFEAVAEAADGELGWELFQSDYYQFVVIDLILPKLDGLKLIKRIFETRSSQRILVLSSECDDYSVKEVCRLGILGFVDKPKMTEEILLEAIRTVLDGRIYMSPEARTVLNRVGEDTDAYYKVLTDRELEVLRLLAQCNSEEEIGQQLNISAFTARRHRLNIKAKLDMRSDAELVQYALNKGIVKHKGGLDWT